MSRRREIRIVAVDRTTGTRHVDECFLLAPGERVQMNSSHSIEMFIEMRERHQAPRMNRHVALQHGVAAHFVDTNPSGEVRSSMEYIKGFNDGADVMTDAADRILGRLVSYLRSNSYQEHNFIPHPRMTHLQDVCDQAMREWIEFKKGK